MKDWFLTTEDEEISVLDLPENIANNSLSAIGEQQGLKHILDSLEKDILERTYKEYSGNISALSRRLNVSRQSILRRMEKHGITKK